MKISRYLKKIFVFAIVSSMAFQSVVCSGAISKTILGDADNDGIISVNDCTYIQKYLAGKELDLGENFVSLADFNKDAIIDVNDVTYLQMYLASKIEYPGDEPETTQSTTSQSTSTTEMTTAQTEPVSTSTQPTSVSEQPTQATAQTTIPYEIPSKLELNKSALDLGIGEKYTLIVNCDVTNYYREFYSTNNSVATVSDDGTVEAVGVGECSVVCSSSNGIVAVCTITVKNMATSVTLNKSSLSLGVSETFDLNSSIPSDSFAYFRTYSSNDSSVASVSSSNGIVTANKIGSTSIVCKLYNGVYTTCTVTVKNAPTSSNVSLNYSSKTVTVGNSVTISPVFSNSASETISYSSSNTSVATVSSSGKVVAMKEGSTTVTAKMYNGVKKTCSLKVEGSSIKYIDVSEWQGNIDFTKVKAAGYSYVILRAGYGNLSSQIDTKFNTYYTQAKAAGLKVGAYWFSYSVGVLDSQLEASACLKVLNGKQLDLPLFYDVELDSQANYGKNTLTAMVNSFCAIVENGGYRAGVYSNLSMLNNSMNLSSISNNYSVWLAQWNDTKDISCDIWQKGDNATVSGIGTNVDYGYIFNMNIIS